ncbi:MAG: PD-(D/E)XK nuclease family protein, partial [Treponema sp.]|nr:PD-(D/E)XK nuclease family protein [Treponema sp.]
DEIKRMAEEEFKRLFYVAVTRAEKDVCMLGDWKEPKKTSGTAELPLMQRIICSYYEDARHASFQTGSDVFIPGAPFFFQSIAPVSREEAYAGRGGEHDAAALMKKAEAVFAAEPSVAFEQPDSGRKTPHSLETAGKAEAAQGPDLYPALSPLLEKYGGETGADEEDSLEREEDVLASGGFNSASFGSLAHSCLEALANGVPPEAFSPDGRKLKELSAEDARTLCGICTSMASRFAASALGRAFAAAKEAGLFAKAEYAFRMFKDGIFYTGCIDLLFQNAGSPSGSPQYTIVDYKSDARINRERYRGQLACYREAAAKMLGVEESQIRLYLYFLRFDEAVELS